MTRPKTKVNELEGGLYLAQGDALLWLKSLPDEVADCVITDIPYASLEKHRSKGTTTRLSNSKSSSNDWFRVIPNSVLPELCLELYRVLKPKTHCYMFCDDETSDLLKKAGTEAGFYCWKRLVWNKEAMGMGYHYRAQYEFILFFEKGKSKWVPQDGKSFKGTRQLNSRSISDILSHKRICGSDAYPTEKPVDLLEVLVTNSTVRGELVIDPFMGSGNTGEASLKNGRYFWGCDISDESLARSEKLLLPYSFVIEATDE